MNDIKLWIGNLNYPTSKLPWIPTIDSVLSTQRYIKNKYDYMTVIIFRKLTNDDYIYTINNDVLYTSSMTDVLTQHIGTDGTITMNGIWDYYDGNYYYSYLIMYSNTFDVWNVINNGNTYAVLYDQSVANIKYPYIMNEWRISKNVTELIVETDVNNVSTLIIPNQMPNTINIENFYSVNNCTKFQLFNILNPISNQEIETYNGLLYTINQVMLIAVPNKYQPDINSNINISTECVVINSNAFSNGTPDMQYDVEFNMIYGENVEILDDYALSFIKNKIISFPKLESIGEFAIYENESLETLYLPVTLQNMTENSIAPNTNKFRTIIFEYNFGINLSTPLYLQFCNALNIDNLALQFNNLGITDGSIIYLHPDVYNSLSVEQIQVATDKGWKVEQL